MRVRYPTLIATVALIVASCSGGSAETTTTVDAPTTTTTATTTTTSPPTTTTTLPPVPEELAFLGGPDTARFTERITTVVSSPGVVDTRIATTVEGRYAAPSNYAYTMKHGSGLDQRTSEIVTLGFDHWILEQNKPWREAESWDVWFDSFHSTHGLLSSEIDLETLYARLGDAEFEETDRNGVVVRAYPLGRDVLDVAVDWSDFTTDLIDGVVTDSAGKAWISPLTYDLVQFELTIVIDLGGMEGLDDGTTAEITVALALDGIDEDIDEIVAPDVPVFAGVPDGFLPFEDPASGVELVYPAGWTLNLDDEMFYLFGEPVVNFLDPVSMTDLTIEVIDLGQFAGMPLDGVVELFETDFEYYGMDSVGRDAVTVADRDGVVSKWRYLEDEYEVKFDFTIVFDGDRAVIVMAVVDEFAEPFDRPLVDDLLESLELSEPTGGVTG